MFCGKKRVLCLTRYDNSARFGDREYICEVKGLSGGGGIRRVRAW